MQRRLISSKMSVRTDTLVNIYKDTEWGEYIVYYVINGERDEPSSYHTLGDSSTDKADAIHMQLVMMSADRKTLPLKARQ